MKFASISSTANNTTGPHAARTKMATPIANATPEGEEMHPQVVGSNLNR